MRHALLCLFLVQLTSQALGHVFSVNLWPGEGKPVLVATGEAIVVFKEPSSGAPPVAVLKLKKDTPVSFSEARKVTLKAGVIKFKKGTEVSGTAYGKVTTLTESQYYQSGKPVTVRFLQDELVDYLQYRAEGTFFVQRGGVVMALSEGPSPDVEPNIEWWVRLKPTSKSSKVGWIRVDGIAVREKGNARRF